MHPARTLSRHAAAFALVLASAVASAEAPAKVRKPTLAMLNVEATDRASEGDAGSMEGLLVVGLEGGGRIQVTGRRDIATILGFEQQKQLLGCDTDSCVTELAGALGVDWIASADVGRLGDVIVLNVKVLDAKKGTALARASRRVGSSEEIPLAVDGMTKEVVDALMGDTAAVVRQWSLVGGAVVAAASFVIAGLLGAQSRSLLDSDTAGTEGALTTHTVTERAADRAAGLATGANLLFGLGTLAALGTGVGFFVTLPAARETAASGGGGGLVLSGSF